MKKRKVKLFASIASLAMVVAVMGVGVWAASQQAVGVTSQVSFTATSIAATVDFKVGGDGVATTNGATLTQAVKIAGSDQTSADAYTNTLRIAEFGVETAKDTTRSHTVQVTAWDNGGDGYVDATDVVTYTFTITPASGDAAGSSIYYYIEVDSESTAYKHDFTTGEQTNIEGTAISSATTIIITFATTDQTKYANNKTNATDLIPDVKIYMANTVANLDEIVPAELVSPGQG